MVSEGGWVKGKSAEGTQQPQWAGATGRSSHSGQGPRDAAGTAGRGQGTHFGPRRKRCQGFRKEEEDADHDEDGHAAEDIEDAAEPA